MARQKRTQSRSTKKNTLSRKENSRVASTTKAKSKTSVSKTTHLKLPGLLAHTRASWDFAWNDKQLFARILAFGWVAILLVIGVSQYAQYQSAQDMASLFSGEAADGLTRGALEIGVLLLSVLGGGQNVNLTETQQIVSGFIYLFVALTTIWLMRRRLADSDVRFRDGLYSAGAPIIAVGVICIVGLLQLLPLAIATNVVSMLGGALQGLLFEIGATAGLILIGVITLYWLVTTVFAAIVATIPGMYPFEAWRSARQLVSGRRTALLLRFIWLGLVCLVGFAAVAIMVIFLGRLLGGAGVLLSSLMIQLTALIVYIYAVVYGYLLYRKVVDGRS